MDIHTMFNIEDQESIGSVVLKHIIHMDKSRPMGRFAREAPGNVLMVEDYKIKKDYTYKKKLIFK